MSKTFSIPWPRRDVSDWVALAFLALFTLSAILGYGIFGLNPGRIPDSDFARDFYGVSFRLFARAQIIVAALVLAIPLIRKAGFRWVPAFVAVFMVSFLSEHLGTGYGFPFGAYEYTGLLGYKLGGRVPFVIPVSWFLMALPAWIMAHAVFPSPGNRAGRVILAAYLLTAWDLALDPAMSFLTPYWIWESTGPFYGMPWVNLAGWMGTGIVLMLLLELLGTARWATELDFPWIVSYYAVVLLMPLGMILAAGLWLAVFVTLAALGLAWGVHHLSRRRLRAASETLALAHEGRDS